MSAQHGDDLTRVIVASQKRFYDLRAPDYLTGAPSDREDGSKNANQVGVPARDRRAILDRLHIAGDVLELGCGPGGFTRELAGRARSVTALDSSPTMLARNRTEVARSNVRYVEADVFDWVPEARYDIVFFGFLLSHVPPSLFASFWRLVGTCLREGGRACFVDEADRVAHYDDVRVVDGVPIARRKLVDGREFDIVKVFWAPEPLEAALREVGWNVAIERLGDAYICGVGAPDVPNAD